MRELSFALYFIGLIPIICLSAMLFTFLTFLIDVIRFPYPERPIIIYGVCYMMVSLIFFVGFLLEDRVACSASSSAQYQASTVTQGSHKACIMLFMILYFFLLCLAAFDGCFLPSRGSWQLCQSGVLKLLRRKPCYFVPVRGASLEH